MVDVGKKIPSKFSLLRGHTAPPKFLREEIKSNVKEISKTFGIVRSWFWENEHLLKIILITSWMVKVLWYLVGFYVCPP